MTCLLIVLLILSNSVPARLVGHFVLQTAPWAYLCVGQFLPLLSCLTNVYLTENSGYHHAHVARVLGNASPQNLPLTCFLSVAKQMCGASRCPGHCMELPAFHESRIPQEAAAPASSALVEQSLSSGSAFWLHQIMVVSLSVCGVNHKGPGIPGPLVPRPPMDVALGPQQVEQSILSSFFIAFL